VAIRELNLERSWPSPVEAVVVAVGGGGTEYKPPPAIHGNQLTFLL